MSNTLLTVLGADGFIGSHLLKELRLRGMAYRAPTREDRLYLEQPLGHVIYAIGLTADFRTRPFDTIDAHVCVLSEVLKHGNFDSLTYLSSTRIYNRSESSKETDDIRVNSTCPDNLYNISKLCGESLCLASNNAKVKIARLSNIVGLRKDCDIFIDQLLNEGFINGTIILKSALHLSKDYLYIDDAVQLLLKIAVSPYCGVFNVASGTLTSNRQILDSIQEILGIPYIAENTSPQPDNEAIDVTKLKSTFLYSPQRFEDYFPEYLKIIERNRG